MRIKVIKAKKPTYKRQRVCAYVRVSAATEELEESLETQKQHFTDVITSHPDWEFCGLYVDDGISGFLNQRPRFQAMMQDARDGKFDLIMVKSVSRFARNTETLLTAIRELKSMGIGVYFELQRLNTLTASGELMLTIKAAFAQGESDSGSQLVKMAYRNRFEKGIPTTKMANTYGYRLRADGVIEIDESQAKIVRMIFDLAEKGVWVSKIRTKLNALAIPSPEGSQWCDTVLARMLRNVIYKGDLLLQKTYRDANHMVHRNRGEAQSWYVRDDHPAIISREQWERVQKELAARTEHLEESKRRTSPTEKRSSQSRYPLTGLMHCPHCGAVLHHKWCNRGKDEYWVCSTNIKKKASSCQGIFIPARFTEGWHFDEPVVVVRCDDENGMMQFTAFLKEEYDAMKGE